jgi:hypothetical protein
MATEIIGSKNLIIAPKIIYSQQKILENIFVPIPRNFYITYAVKFNRCNVADLLRSIRNSSNLQRTDRGRELLSLIVFAGSRISKSNI